MHNLFSFLKFCEVSNVWCYYYNFVLLLRFPGCVTRRVTGQGLTFNNQRYFFVLLFEGFCFDWFISFMILLCWFCCLHLLVMVHIWIVVRCERFSDSEARQGRIFLSLLLLHLRLDKLVCFFNICVLFFFLGFGFLMNIAVSFLFFL